MGRWDNKPSLEERFWKKVRVAGIDECWQWTASTNKKGYGYFGIDGKIVLAHRVSWMIHVGDPGNLNVCHSCDNPGCVNPAHLWLGTHADNNRDRHVKGRTKFVRFRGQESPNAKLTDKDVQSIIRSSENNMFFAEKYQVSDSLISMIRTGKRWKHMQKD